MAVVSPAEASTVTDQAAGVVQAIAGACSDSFYDSFACLLAALGNNDFFAPVATFCGILGIAFVRELLRAVVQWTPVEVDNKILEVVLKAADKVTSKSAERGSKAAKK